MILLIQASKKASVEVNQSVIASISTGILAYVGVEKEDTEQDIQLAAKKLSGIRIFEDSQERMSLSL